MGNKASKKNKKETEIAIKVAVITGVFGVVVAIVTTIGNNLVSFVTSRNSPQPVSLPISKIEQNCESLSEVETIDDFNASVVSPIRLDVVVNISPSHLLPTSFNPQNHNFTDESSILSLPPVDKLELFIDFVGLNEKEWVRVENFFVVYFEKIVSIKGQNNNIATRGYGGSGRYYQSFTCWTGLPMEGILYKSSPLNGGDFFTLSPGELIPTWLTLDLSQLDPAVYDLAIGVVYSYQGRTYVNFVDYDFSITIPDKTNSTYWSYLNSSDSGKLEFKK